jgi:hypothetical protein
VDEGSPLIVLGPLDRPLLDDSPLVEWLVRPDVGKPALPRLAFRFEPPRFDAPRLLVRGDPVRPELTEWLDV